MVELYDPMKRLASLGVFFWLACVAPLGAEVQDANYSHNIQIVVDIRQAGFQNQAGMRSVSQATQTQFLVVTEGVEGKIFLGNKVPYVAYYQNFLNQEGYLAGQITFQEVGTSLIVKARVVGGEIEVTLTPEISYETQDGRGSIAVQRLSTSVRVRQGQSLEIGGNISKSEFENNFYRSESGTALQVVLTPKILD